MKKLLGYLLIGIPVVIYIIAMFLHGVSKYGLYNTVFYWGLFIVGAAIMFLGVELTE